MPNRPSISYLARNERHFAREGQIVLRYGKGAVVSDHSGTLFLISISGHFLGQWVTFEEYLDNRPTSPDYSITRLVDFARIKVIPPPIPTFFTNWKKDGKTNKTVVLYIQDPQEVETFVVRGFNKQFKKLPCFIYRKWNERDQTGNKAEWDFLPDHVNDIFEHEDAKFSVDPTEYVERVRHAAPFEACSYDVPGDLKESQPSDQKLFEALKSLMNIEEVQTIIKKKNCFDFIGLLNATNVPNVTQT